MKVVFMGTPDFAVATVDAIAKAGHEIVMVVTQPDKPKGRGKEMQFPAVKTWAVEHDIPVYQPKRIREPEAVEVLKKQDADIFIVAAFGQILPKEVLEIPPLGCVNVHASLLPKYRGAAPIQWAVMNGDEVSGVRLINDENEIVEIQTKSIVVATGGFSANSLQPMRLVEASLINWRSSVENFVLRPWKGLQQARLHRFRRRKRKRLMSA